MSDVFKKLNLKDQQEILVLNAPASFAAELDQIEQVAVQRSVDAVPPVTRRTATARALDASSRPYPARGR